MSSVGAMGMAWVYWGSLVSGAIEVPQGAVSQPLIMCWCADASHILCWCDNVGSSHSSQAPSGMQIIGRYDEETQFVREQVC